MINIFSINSNVSEQVNGPSNVTMMPLGLAGKYCKDLSITFYNRSHILHRIKSTKSILYLDGNT